MANKIVVAVTGASGAIYPKLLLDKLLHINEQWDELSVVMSANAKSIWATELGSAPDSFFEKNSSICFFEKNDFSAPFASGSAQYNIMFGCPCSMGTLARIAAGLSDDLITRAADVMLKERRRLVLMIRETPYSLLHIKNMEAITIAGGIVCPASPSFYSLPKTIEEVAATVVDRMLDIAGLNISSFRWGK